MGSPEIIYCFSDDEPIFVQNQRRIQEHGVKEEQSDTRAHFRKLIDKLAEKKKRKYLHIVAELESSSLPIACPLYKSLTVSIAYPP